MHELVFAEQILSCIQEQAEKNQASQVLSVRLLVGTLSGIDKK
jgi:Zn finger protein HypA/HybF involved in hydrogenase expression